MLTNKFSVGQWDSMGVTLFHRIQISSLILTIIIVEGVPSEITYVKLLISSYEWVKPMATVLLLIRISRSADLIYSVLMRPLPYKNHQLLC